MRINIDLRLCAGVPATTVYRGWAVQRALHAIKRALYSIIRALHVMKIALYSIQRALHALKEPYIL